VIRAGRAVGAIAALAYLSGCAQVLGLGDYEPGPDAAGADATMDVAGGADGFSDGTADSNDTATETASADCAADCAADASGGDDAADGDGGPHRASLAARNTSPRVRTARTSR